MGWYYTNGASKADIIAEITAQSITNGEVVARVVKKSVQGNVLWLVEEGRNPGEAWGDNPKRQIMCYLLNNSGGEGYGYKPISESMGPSEASCPIKFLDLAPEPNSTYSHDWRGRVREYHRRQSVIKSLAGGDTITFENEFDYGHYGKVKVFDVADIKKRHFYGQRSDGGHFLCRLRADSLTDNLFTVERTKRTTAT